MIPQLLGVVNVFVFLKVEILLICTREDVANFKINHTTLMYTIVYIFTKASSHQLHDTCDYES